MFRRSFYRTHGKRVFDAAGAGLLLLMLAPVMAVVALLLRLFLGSPVLFVQLRPGLMGKPFRLFKFRTMTDERDALGDILPDASRMTTLGAALRRLSLDELPELFNVVRGEMSLVGPRPWLTEYLPLYSAEQRRRHDVRPGLTGLAQIAGRNSLEWQAKLRLDTEYVDKLSFGLDLRILAKTVGAVLGRRGINQDGFATADKFRGDSS